MSSELKDGDYVRIKKTGRVGKLIEINPDPDYDPEDEYWAVVDTPSEGIEVDRPEEVEKVDWQPPTGRALARAVASALHGGWDDLEVHDTYADDDGVEVGARWKGVDGGFIVRITPFDTDMA